MTGRFELDSKKTKLVSGGAKGSETAHHGANNFVIVHNECSSEQL